MSRITVLVENAARRAGLLAEHGLSFWIDTGRHRVLFDTGQGMALAHNAKALGIDLSTADAIVISHGHSDHVGGLPTALASAPAAPLWLHPQATTPKFRRLDNGAAKRIGTDLFESAAFGDRPVHPCAGPSEVVPGVWLTGTIPRHHPLEDTGGAFFHDPDLTVPDPLDDDMALVLDQGRGALSVLFGCAHAGAINTLEHIRQTHGDRPVDTLLGGLHLGTADDKRVTATCDHLRFLRPRRHGFCHCTGRSALCRIAEALPDGFLEASTGLALDTP